MLLAIMLRLSEVVVAWDIYLGRCGRARRNLFIDHRRINVFTCVLNFCGLSQPRNSFNSEIFPIFTICLHSA